MATDADRIEQLRAEIRYHDHQYHVEAKPEISDNIGCDNGSRPPWLDAKKVQADNRMRLRVEIGRRPALCGPAHSASPASGARAGICQGLRSEKSPWSVANAARPNSANTAARAKFAR